MHAQTLWALANSLQSLGSISPTVVELTASG